MTGQEPEISGRQGAADARFLNGFGRIPTVIFGPGPTSQMHANNEWVSVERPHRRNEDDGALDL